jgi:hypothetical protein
MSRELFSYDATTGMSVWFDYNELTDEATLEYEQDVEPILEVNKMQANDSDFTKQGIKQEMWKYASIPVGLQMKWLIEEGLDVYDDNAWPQIFRKLNDPEYAYLKTTHKYHRK